MQAFSPVSLPLWTAYLTTLPWNWSLSCYHIVQTWNAVTGLVGLHYFMLSIPLSVFMAMSISDLTILCRSRANPDIVDLLLQQPSLPLEYSGAALRMGDCVLHSLMKATRPMAPMIGLLLHHRKLRQKQYTSDELNTALQFLAGLLVPISRNLQRE